MAPPKNAPPAQVATIRDSCREQRAQRVRRVRPPRSEGGRGIAPGAEVVQSIPGDRYGL